MGLRIITGTLLDIRDNGRRDLYNLFKKGFFKKVRIDAKGKLSSYDPGIISWYKKGTTANIIQETGAGKTIIAMKLVYFAHLRGRRIGGNIKIKWTNENINKDSNQWIPTLNSIEDLQNAENMEIVIDDIYGTCQAWNTKESKMLGVAALIARKAWLDLDITSQFLENQVPPNLQRVCGEYHIPYIRVEDTSRKSPDGKHFIPVEILDLVFNSNRIFKYCKRLNMGTETGQEILNGFDTLEVATQLKKSKGIPQTTIINPRQKEPYEGYNNEADFIASLSKYVGTIRHLSKENPHKHRTDIIFQDGRTYYIDVVGISDGKYPTLNTAHKEITEASLSQDPGIIDTLGFKYRDVWRIIERKHLVGKSGNIRISQEVRAKMFSLDQIFHN